MIRVHWALTISRRLEKGLGLIIVELQRDHEGILLEIIPTLVGVSGLGFSVQGSGFRV